MKILVLGASGIAGRSLVPHLLAAGHDVAAQARTMARLRPPADAGATPVPADPTDPRVLRQLLRGRDAVYDLRVAIPPTTRAALPGAWRQYARLRGAGCGLVVDAALEAGMPRVIRDTVTMVYASGGDNWLDENHPARAHGSLAANLAAERHLARLSAAGGHGVAIRFGGFYGPGDNFSRDVIAAAMKGRALFTGPPDGWTSATHTTDVGTALAAALTVPAGIYNAVDDEPLTRRDLLDILAHAAGRPCAASPGTALARQLAGALTVQVAPRLQRPSALTRMATHHPQPPPGLARHICSDYAKHRIYRTGCPHPAPAARQAFR